MDSTPNVLLNLLKLIYIREWGDVKRKTWGQNGGGKPRWDYDETEAAARRLREKRGERSLRCDEANIVAL